MLLIALKKVESQLIASWATRLLQFKLNYENPVSNLVKWRYTEIYGHERGLESE